MAVVYVRQSSPQQVHEHRESADLQYDSTMSSQVDAMFIVARIDVVTRAMLKELRRTFDSAPKRILGVVVSTPDDERGLVIEHEREAGQEGHDAKGVSLGEHGVGDGLEAPGRR